MGTSVANIKAEFLSDMGGGEGGLVTVELSDVAFTNSVKAAKRWFTAKKGFIIYRPVTVVAGQLEYKMKDDVQQVLDVIFQVPTDVAAFFTMGFFDIIPYGPNSMMTSGPGMSNYSGFAQLLQATEMRKRIFSVEPDWQYDQQTKLLHVTARGGSFSAAMLVQLKVNDFDPGHLNDKDDYLFVRYVKAKCKEVVGRTRSKYDSLPGAGGPTTMDGNRLLDEAKEELLALDIEIFASQGPDIPMIG